MLKLTYPLPHQVIQRDARNEAAVDIRGCCDTSADRIEVRFVPFGDNPEFGETTPWHRVAPWFDAFSTVMTVKAGWYRIEVQQYRGEELLDHLFLHPFGVGEVFALFGHSLVQGGELGAPGASDLRVSCLVQDANPPTAETVPLEFGPLKSGSGFGPFHGAPYAWGLLGDRLVKRLKVPVLFYGCGFGGTNIEHNYKTIRRIPFEHGFCRFNQGMPFRPLGLVLQRFVPETGIRAILCQHGINDSGLNDRAAEFRDMFHFVIDYTRATFTLPDLAWVLTRESKPGTPFENIRATIDRMLAEEREVYPGPDFARYTATTEGRDDRIHLASPTDCELYARIWDEALNDDFFNHSRPMVRRPGGYAG